MSHPKVFLTHTLLLLSLFDVIIFGDDSVFSLEKHGSKACNSLYLGGNKILAQNECVTENELSEYQVVHSGNQVSTIKKYEETEDYVILTLSDDINTASPLPISPSTNNLQDTISISSLSIGTKLTIVTLRGDAEVKYDVTLMCSTKARIKLGKQASKWKSYNFAVEGQGIRLTDEDKTAAIIYKIGNKEYLIGYYSWYYNGVIVCVDTDTFRSHYHHDDDSDSSSSSSSSSSSESHEHEHHHKKHHHPPGYNHKNKHHKKHPEGYGGGYGNHGMGGGMFGGGMHGGGPFGGGGNKNPGGLAGGIAGLLGIGGPKGGGKKSPPSTSTDDDNININIDINLSDTEIENHK